MTNFLLDIQGEKVAPGATFTLILSPDRFLNPGTQWEGVITALLKRRALRADRLADLRRGRRLPPGPRLNGHHNAGVTEISAGVEEGRSVLVLDDKQLRGSARHKQEDPLKTPRQARSPQDEEASSPVVDPAPDKKPDKHATVIDSAPVGEDDYAEPHKPGIAPTRRVLAIVLAGGKGERLHPLTHERSKPAVPFGGNTASWTSCSRT